MRPALFVLFFVASSAVAEDARVSILAKQFANARDPRVRTQTVLLLGQTGSDDAVPHLCAALKDPEVVVRTATASALGDLRSAKALECVKAAMGETDPAVRAALTKAMATGVVAPGALYVNVEPVQDKVGGLPADVIKLTDKLLRDKLQTMGASVAPANEEKKSAAALIKSKNLRGYALRVQLLPGTAANGLKLEMLVMTYPEQSLQGSWSVKGAHPKVESLIKAMVPKVVDDAAGELQWK